MGVFTETKFQLDKVKTSFVGNGAKSAVTSTATVMQGDTAGMLAHGVHTGGELFGLVAQGSIAILGISLGAIWQHRMLHKEHDREEERIAETYRRELAAQNGIRPQDVKVEHLKRSAEHNGILAQALNDNDRKVRLNMGAWLGAATFAAIATFTLAPVLATALGIGGTAAGIGLGAKALFFGIKFAAGISLFHIARPLARKIGEKLMGMGGHTSHDYVKEMKVQHQHGKPLAPEQVLGVFVKANPEMDESIRARTGKTYEQLLKARDGHNLQALVQEYDTRFQLYELAHQINSGTIEPTELAWRAEGKFSGVMPHDPGDTALARAKHAMSHAAAVAKETAKGALARTGLYHPAPAAEAEAESPSPGFADRFARNRQAGLSRVEQLEAQKAAPQQAPVLPGRSS